jgi:hypothetical protein
MTSINQPHASCLGQPENGIPVRWLVPFLRIFFQKIFSKNFEKIFWEKISRKFSGKKFRENFLKKISEKFFWGERAGRFLWDGHNLSCGRNICGHGCRRGHWQGHACCY